MILIRRKTRNFIAQYVHRRLEQSYSPLNQRPRIANTSRPTATPRSLRAGVRATLFDLGNKQASNAPSDEDFLRVCRLTAFACLEGSFNPHDISEDYLRGVLDVEANRSPFYDNGGAKLS